MWFQIIINISLFLFRFVYSQKGQILINQINSMDSEFKATGLLDANKTPDLFISNKNTSHLTSSDISNIQKKKPVQAWALADQNSGGESS